MKKKALLLGLCIICLLLVPTIIACKETYLTTEEVIIEDVIETTGTGATCNISIYTNLTLIQSGLMEQNGIAYQYNASFLDEGIYTSSINCNITNNLFIGECKFSVEMEDTMLGIVIGLAFAIIYFVFIGFLAKSFVMKFLSFGLSLIQVIMLMGILFFNEAGASILGMLEINFYIVLFTGFIVGFITFFQISKQLLNPLKEEGPQVKDIDEWGEQRE